MDISFISLLKAALEHYKSLPKIAEYSFYQNENVEKGICYWILRYLKGEDIIFSFFKDFDRLMERQGIFGGYICLTLETSRMINFDFSYQEKITEIQYNTCIAPRIKFLEESIALLESELVC